MISGNVRVFHDDERYRQFFAVPNTTRAARLRPEPTHAEPTGEMNRAAAFVNDAYRYAQGDVDQLQAEMQEFESELDTSLSNDAGIVFEDARGRIVVALRGRDPSRSNTSRDDANVLDVVRGRAPRHSEDALKLLRGAVEKYGVVNDLYAYSMGGSLATHAVREMPELFAESIENVQLVNPLLGPRDVSRGIPEQFHIARTVEDFASGPGLSLALRNGTVRADQIETVRGIAGDGEHSLGHFLDVDEPRGLTPVERAIEAHEMAVVKHAERPTPKTRATLKLRASELAAAAEGHTHVAGHGIAKTSTGFVAGLAADAVMQNTPVLRDQSEVVQKIEVGAVSGAAAGATGAALTGGSTLAAMAAEIPPAVAATLVGSATADAIEQSGFKDNAFITKTELAGTVGGAAGGAAAAVTADALIAGAGVVGALATGTELGAAFGSVGGPVGLAVGAGVGALIGGSVAAVTELVDLFRHH